MELSSPRFFLGVDNPPLIKARREMSEEEYMRFVRKTYYQKMNSLFGGCFLYFSDKK